MGELSNLPNIGTVIEKQLNTVGITTEEELKQIGSKGAWLKIKAMDDSACIHRLYSLQGAIEGIRKVKLSKEMKTELKAFYDKETH